MRKSTKVLIIIDIFFFIMIPLASWWGNEQTIKNQEENFGGLLGIYPAIVFFILTLVVVFKANFIDTRKK